MPKIVHISYTPLAGSPIRIVNALNRHTDCEVRLVTLDNSVYGNRTFAGDLDWQLDREECIAEIGSADILHFHHFFDLKDNLFSLDFTDVAVKAKYLRQFHSTPLTIAKGDEALAKEIVDSNMPQVVIAQYPERYLPKAKIVPNIIPQDAIEYLPLDDKPESLKVCYAPSILNSCWNDDYDYSRWDTKGSAETITMVNDALRQCKAGSMELISDIPHGECLRLKRQCHIGIDELATGSFHLSSLEFLSQGIPTMAYLDNRTIETLKFLTGADNFPWVNVMLEHSRDVLVDLLNDESLRQELGQSSRKWVEEYYREEQLIKYYMQAYDDLIETGVVLEKPRYNSAIASQRWMAYGQYDSAWQGRVRNNKTHKSPGFLGFWK